MLQRGACHGMAYGTMTGMHGRGRSQVLLQKVRRQGESSYCFVTAGMGTCADRLALALLLRMVPPWLSDLIIFHYSGSSKFAFSPQLNLRDKDFFQNRNIISYSQIHRLTQSSLQISAFLIIIPMTCMAKMRGNILKFLWNFTELQIIK